jgi:hypothetical protein
LGRAEDVFGVAAIEGFAASVYEACAVVSFGEVCGGSGLFDHSDEFFACGMDISQLLYKRWLKETLTKDLRWIRMEFINKHAEFGWCRLIAIASTELSTV